MAKLPKAINRNELPSMTEFSALPKGNYNTIITKTGYEISDNGKESIVFTLKVIDGEYKNRCIFASLTQVQPLNPNESDPDKAQKNKDIAENIGKKLLNSLMMATDMSVFEDTDEFLNKMVEVKLNLRPATEKYSERNEIVSFSEYKGDTIPPANSALKSFNAMMTYRFLLTEVLSAESESLYFLSIVVFTYCLKQNTYII